ncbi:MAG TPA: hypothetical protein VEC36_00455, partial [Patescibacteria group bacterium]|nr:hypothetical protein [Patescibacteria group bacterium]
MSKKRIVFITALITLSLLGLVAVQLFWIQNAIVVKEEQLSHNVAAAMQSVVHKIETQEAVAALAHWKNRANEAEELAKAERELQRHQIRVQDQLVQSQKKLASKQSFDEQNIAADRVRNVEDMRESQRSLTRQQDAFSRYYYQQPV